jgi:hypothetical protein
VGKLANASQWSNHFMGDARSEERKHFVVGGNFCELFNFGDVAQSDKLTFPIIEKETFKCQI